MDYLDTRTIYTIVHILGTTLGVGGAYMSDLMFFRCVKDKKITQSELGFLKLGSGMVWVGLFVLVLSGAFLFMGDPAGYLSSSKFLVKMTIVLIIILNGAIFHYMHIPRIARHIDKHLPNERAFMRKSPVLVASGAVSFVSWTAAFVLGVLRGIPYGYVEGMAWFGLALVVAVVVALMFRRRILS